MTRQTESVSAYPIHVKAHVEIKIRLKPKNGESLHDILRAFAGKTKGWRFPQKESEDYQLMHRGPAGFADCVADHIAHFRKMVGNGVAAFDAGFLGLRNYRLEVAEGEILQHLRQVAGRP
jgi:hypothetical protein